MVRSRGKGPVELLSKSEREGLENQKAELESQLKELDEFGQGTPAAQMDKAEIKRQIARIEKALAARETPHVTGAKKDELIKEAHEIEEKLRDGMPTRDEMNHPARYPGAVRKHLNWLKRNAALIERYRHIQLLVNPDQPESVETLRKDR